MVPGSNPIKIQQWTERVMPHEPMTRTCSVRHQPDLHQQLESGRQHAEQDG